MSKMLTRMYKELHYQTLKHRIPMVSNMNKANHDEIVKHIVKLWVLEFIIRNHLTDQLNNNIQRCLLAAKYRTYSFETLFNDLMTNHDTISMELLIDKSIDHFDGEPASTLSSTFLWSESLEGREFWNCAVKHLIFEWDGLTRHMPSTAYSFQKLDSSSMTETRDYKRVAASVLSNFYILTKYYDEPSNSDKVM